MLQNRFVIIGIVYCIIILQYLYKLKLNVILSAYVINNINNNHFYECEKSIYRQKCVVISMFILWWVANVILTSIKLFN